MADSAFSLMRVRRCDVMRMMPRRCGCAGDAGGGRVCPGAGGGEGDASPDGGGGRQAGGGATTDGEGRGARWTPVGILFHSWRDSGMSALPLPELLRFEASSTA